MFKQRWLRTLRNLWDVTGTLVSPLCAYIIPQIIYFSRWEVPQESWKKSVHNAEFQTFRKKTVDNCEPAWYSEFVGRLIKLLVFHTFLKEMRPMVELDSGIIKLHQVDSEKMNSVVEKLLLPDEEVVGVYKTVRDSVVFTDRRIIATDVKGAGKKTDVTSIPYRQINKFSVQTSGILDVDSELEIHLICGETLHFEFMGTKAVYDIGQALAKFSL